MKGSSSSDESPIGETGEFGYATGRPPNIGWTKASSDGGEVVTMAGGMALVLPLLFRFGWGCDVVEEDAGAEADDTRGV